MRELVVDNGVEFHSLSLENACYSLGIELHYAARKTPWFKGKIERFLGTLNRAVSVGTPGTTFADIFEKGDYDPSKHAVVRHSVFTEIANTWIADVYHQQVHRALDVPPAVMWANSIAPEDILVPDDPARLDAILGRSEIRKLTHKGIELDGLFYNSPEMTRLRQRHGDKFDVEVRADAADLGKIIVFSPDQRQMFSVPALRADYASGLSAYQHRVCKRYAADKLGQNNTEGWLEAKARIAELIENELMHKKRRTRTRIARYQGDSKPIACAEREELLAAQDPTSAELGLESDDISPASASLEAPADIKAQRRFKPEYRDRSSQVIWAQDEI
jgi:putative transposase